MQRGWRLRCAGLRLLERLTADVSHFSPPFSHSPISTFHRTISGHPFVKSESQWARIPISMAQRSRPLLVYLQALFFLCCLLHYNPLLFCKTGDVSVFSNDDIDVTLQDRIYFTKSQMNPMHPYASKAKDKQLSHPPSKLKKTKIKAYAWVTEFPDTTTNPEVKRKVQKHISKVLKWLQQTPGTPIPHRVKQTIRKNSKRKKNDEESAEAEDVEVPLEEWEDFPPEMEAGETSAPPLTENKSS